MAWRKLIHRGLDGWVVQGKPGRHTPRTLSATLLLPKPLTHLALDQLIGHARSLHWAALDALSRPPSALPRHGDREALVDDEILHLQTRRQHDVRVPVQHEEGVADLDERTDEGRAHGGASRAYGLRYVARS